MDEADFEGAIYGTDETAVGVRLGLAGHAVWAELAEVYDFAPGEAAIAVEICRTVDLLARLDSDLERSKLLVGGSRGQVRPNPLLAVVADQRRVLAALWASLDLPDPHEATADAQAEWRQRDRSGDAAGQAELGVGRGSDARIDRKQVGGGRVRLVVEPRTGVASAATIELDQVRAGS